MTSSEPRPTALPDAPRPAAPAEERIALRIPAIAPADLQGREDVVVIDLRSPKEYAEDHLPGAVNVPLFDDLERALIGTLYHRSSRDAAFRAGLERVRAKIVRLVDDVAREADWTPPRDEATLAFDGLSTEGMEAMEGVLALDRVPCPERAVVLHCWRGGLRSRSVVALLGRLGLDRAVVLEKGYKAYRADVRARLAAWQAPPTFVLRGLTGVGKTLVLRALEALRPGWTLDLEGAAGHRSSILGMVGLEPVSQKRFESRLAERIAEGFPGGVVVMEGESRKVGDAIQPESTWGPLRSGTPLELVASLERRVEILVADYLASEDNRAPLAAQLPFIEERLGATKWKGELVRLLETDREAELVEVLLERYYDPLYEHSEKRFLEERRAAGLPLYAARFDTSDTDGATAAIADWIESR